MLKRLVFLLALFVSVSAQAITKLSEDASVSLLTCSPGEKIYELFGHTGIHIVDKSQHIDCVFNYGLFDFNDSNFIFNFLRGKTDYQVGVCGYQDFALSYILRNSSLTELQLNLNQKEKQAIWEKLNWDILPENKVYRYNFIFNNCATRPRDVFERNVEGNISYPLSIQPITYREAIEIYTENAPWAKFAFDLCLGSHTDEVASERDLLFLPELLSESLSQSYIIKDGNKTKLTQPLKEIFPKDTKIENEKNNFFTPIVVFSFLFLIIFLVSVYGYINKTKYHWIDIVLFTIGGMVGSIITFLFFFSKHPFTDANFNIIWLNPFMFAPILIWIFGKKKESECCLIFYFIESIVLTIFIVSMWAIPQYFNPAFIPLILLFLTRSALHVFFWGYHRNKKHHSKKRSME